MANVIAKARNVITQRGSRKEAHFTFRTYSKKYLTTFRAAVGSRLVSIDIHTENRYVI